MQIALLVTPFLVILGWIIGQPMTLHFETFETVVFFLSVLVVNCKRTPPGQSDIHTKPLTRPDPRWKVELLGRGHADWGICYHCPCLLCLSRQRGFERD